MQRSPERTRTRPRGRIHLAEARTGALFVLPVLAGVAVFYLYPILKNFYSSFTQPNVFGTSSKFVGLANYEKLATDSAFGNATVNTLTYTVVLMLGIPIAVIFASLISRPGLRFAKLYRIAFFMPYIAMPTAIALVWRLMFNGDFGIINQSLRSIGISDPPYWTSTPGFAIVAVSIVGMWSSIGFNMIILSAGLQAIPSELYEAASIDGASHWRQFRSITVPLLTPSIFFLTVIQAINGFQVFDLLFAMMGSNNPAMPHTRTFVYLFYNEAFMVNHKGYAAAIAMAILLVVGILTALQFKLQKKWVQYLA